jgi:hypothetical protein
VSKKASATSISASEIQRTLGLFYGSTLYGVGIDHSGPDIRVSKQFLNRPDIIAILKQVGGKTMAVLISILPMKGLQSPFIIITIRFMENTAHSFADYGATQAIKSLLSSEMKCR